MPAPGAGGTSGDSLTSTLTYTYDGLNRVLASSGAGGSRSYRFDLDGNRVYRTDPGGTWTYAYDRTDELASETNGTTTAAIYDAFGNLTKKPEDDLSQTTLAYDAANRLTTITPASGLAASFTFDALSRNKTRVLNSTPLATTDTYHYVADTETAYEVATTGGTTRTIDAALGPDGSRLALKNRAAFGWTLFDLHADLAGLENQAMSAVSDAIRYDGFGLTIDADGSFGSPWKYQGALDLSPNATGTATTSLYDFNARNYAPSLGAFTSLDTFAGSAADPLSLNRFLYAEANPATLIDPTGHKVCTGRNDNDCDTLPADPDKANDVKKKWAQEDKHDQDLCARYGECGSSGGSSGGSKPKPSGATPPPKSVPKSVGPGDIPSWAVVQAALGNRAELDRLARLYGPAALRIGQDGNYDPALLASALTLAEWYQYLTAPADYGDPTKTVRAQTLLTAEQLEDYSVWASQDDTPDGVIFRAIAVGAVLPTGATSDRPFLSEGEETLAVTSGALSDENALRVSTNAVGERYPTAVDARTHSTIPEPPPGLSRVPREDRVAWDAGTRGEYIREWHDRGYSMPEGGWSQYDIHHVIPREFGGTNDFDNLVPVLRDVHRDFTRWWRNY